MKKRLNVLIILDRSGSMSGSESVTVNAINEYMRSLEENDTCEAYVTLKMFDSKSIDTVFDNKLVNGLYFKKEHFVPRGMTPLLDAVGDGVESLDEMIADGELGALIVLTDGKENASTRFNRHQIADLMKKREEEQGWLILFLGADIDAWGEARQIGLTQERTLRFSKARSAEMSEALQGITSDYINSEDSLSLSFDDETRKRVSD